VRRTIILEGKRLDVKIEYSRWERDTLDIPRVGDTWNRFDMPRGVRLELEGVARDGTRVRGVFRVTRWREDGTLEIEPWSDRDKVGGGQE
jgi:hypothetical protein